MPECTVLKPDYEDRPNEPYRLDYLGFRQVEHIENYKDQLAKILFVLSTGLTHYNVEYQALPECMSKLQTLQ